MEWLNNLDLAALVKIIIADILLGGDNAILIGLACASLPLAMRKKAVFWGITGAIVLRGIFLVLAGYLLMVPYLMPLGAVLLLWIGINLIADNDEHEDVKASDNMWGAIKTIIIADAVMSLDNVIAVTGAAQSAGEHATAYAVFGILISIPIILFMSNIIIKALDRFPILIWIGGGMLGWIGGEMIAKSKEAESIVTTHLVPIFGSVHSSHVAVGVLGVAIVLVGAWWKDKKQETERPESAAE